MFNLFRRYKKQDTRPPRKFTVDEVQFGPLLPTDMSTVLQMEKASSPMPWPQSLFEDLDEDAMHTVLAARTGERLVGYVLYENKGEVGHITNICVHPDFRRSGIGSVILIHVLGRMRAEGFIRTELEVRQTNMEAQLFYKSFGFLTYEIVPAGYPDTLEDCFLMRLSLADALSAKE